MNRISFMYDGKLLKPSDDLSKELDTRYLNVGGFERFRLELIWAWVKTVEERKNLFTFAEAFTRCAPKPVSLILLTMIPIDIALLAWGIF